MSPESKVPCPTCGKIISLAWFRPHIKIHEGKLRSKCCSKCDFKSLRSNDVKRHERTVHSMSHRKNMCPICDVSLFQASLLTKHMLDVHRVQVPLCKKCDHRHTRRSQCTFLCGFCSTRSTDIRFVLLHQLTTSCNDERVTHQVAIILAPMPDATVNEKIYIDSVDAETFASEHKQKNNSFKSPEERLAPLKDIKTSENTFTH